MLWNEIQKKFSIIHILQNLLFFFFQPFPSIRGNHSVSSFSKPSCLQCLSPSHQHSPYLLLLHLKIFPLVSLFFSFPAFLPDLPLFLFEIFHFILNFSLSIFHRFSIVCIKSKTKFHTIGSVQSFFISATC